MALIPWSTQIGGPKDRAPEYSYTVKTLIRTRREFEQVYGELLNFGHKLSGLPEPHKQSAKPEDDLPTTQQIADQMHAALGHQRISLAEKKRMVDAENAAKSLETPIHVKPETQGDGQEKA